MTFKAYVIGWDIKMVVLLLVCILVAIIAPNALINTVKLVAMLGMLGGFGFVLLVLAQIG